METRRRIGGLIDFIAERYGRAAEIGIGHFPDVALGLQKRGVNIFATDVMLFVHRGLKVHLDDVTSPNLFLYRRIDLLYAMRPPAELVPYIAKLARIIGADAIVKPLSSEYPEGWRLVRSRDTMFFLKKKWNRYTESKLQE